jgi:signal peptidase II
MDKAYMRSYWRVAWLIILGMALLFLDFVTKAYVYHVLPFYDTCVGARCTAIPIFYDFVGIDFLINLAVNKGAAWGVFADFQVVLLIVRILVIFGLFIYLFFLNQNPYADVPLVLIIAGAIGNVIDFFLYGFVIDFLHFNLWGYHFPIFNFADTCITIGVIWLFLIALFTRKKKTTKFYV